MNNKIKVISKNFQLVLVTKNKYIWYRNGSIYESSSENRSDIHFVKSIYTPNSTLMGKAMKLLVRFKLVQRVLRLQPRAFAYSDTDKVCFAFDKKIYIWDINNNSWDINNVRNEMRNPLDIVYLTGVKDFKDSFVFGEYGWNDDRNPVHIWQYDNGKWSIAYTFEQKTICHVHAIIPDAQNNCVYIMTGDKDSESGIWKATQNFQCVDPIAIGNQQYRSCAGVIQNENIFFATDTPIEKNYLYLLDCDNRIKRVMPLPGSVINSVQIKNNWWFATTVEQDPNLPYLRHCISCKKAPGMQDRYVHIFRKSFEHKAEEIVKMKKDFLPMWLFQFGNVAFIKNYKDDRVYINPIAVYRYSQKTVRVIE